MRCVSVIMKSVARPISAFASMQLHSDGIESGLWGQWKLFGERSRLSGIEGAWSRCNKANMTPCNPPKKQTSSRRMGSSPAGPSREETR